jgi:hypothetical protein
MINEVKVEGWLYLLQEADVIPDMGMGKYYSKVLIMNSIKYNVGKKNIK